PGMMPPGRPQLNLGDRVAQRSCGKISLHVRNHPIILSKSSPRSGWMRHFTLIVMFLSTCSAHAGEPIFEPGAKLKVEAEKGAGEGPAWHPKLGVLMSGNNHVMRRDRDGKTSIYRKDAGTNGLLFDAKGRLLACESEPRRISRTELDGTITILTDKYQGKRYNT